MHIMTGTDIGELAQPALPELPDTAASTGKKVNAANMVVRDQQGLLAIEVAKVTREIEAEGAGVVIQAQQVRQDRRDKLAQLVQ